MIEVVDETGLLGEVEGVIVHAAEKALAHVNRSGDVSVAVVGDERIHELNLRFRGVDAPTDVLSFPSAEGEALVLANEDDFLGDIAISLPAAERQAGQIGQSLARELAFLAVHGVLHLCGYDHSGPGDEAEMLEKQRCIVAALSP